MSRTIGQSLDGECVSWDVEKGFGWVSCEDGGPHLFVHYSAVVVEGDRYKAIQPGTLVTSIFGRNVKGKDQAQRVTARDGSPLLGFVHKLEANQLINPLTWEIPPEEKKEPVKRKPVKIVKREPRGDSGQNGPRVKTRAFKEQQKNQSSKREREANTSWELKSLDTEAPTEAFVQQVCTMLEEPNIILLAKIIECLGTAKTVEILRATESTQASGGLPLPPDKRIKKDGQSRFRTTGGVFIYLAKQAVSDMDWKGINAEVKKHGKKPFTFVPPVATFSVGVNKESGVKMEVGNDAEAETKMEDTVIFHAPISQLSDLNAASATSQPFINPMDSTPFVPLHVANALSTKPAAPASDVASAVGEGAKEEDELLDYEDL